MTFRRRRRLERLAYPDPIRYARTRRRVRWMLIAAVAVAVAHIYLAAVFLVGLALPDLAFIARRELALGALLGDADRSGRLPRAPSRDLRAVYRRL